jgi:hypothetical protein
MWVDGVARYVTNICCISLKHAILFRVVGEVVDAFDVAIALVDAAHVVDVVDAIV